MLLNKKVIGFFRFIIGWPLGILAIFFIARFLAKDSQIFLKLKHIDPTLLFSSLVVFTIYYFLRAYIWKRMMKLKDYDLSMKDVSYAWEFSEIIRFVPGTVLSILSRAKLFQDLKVPPRTTGKILLTEVELLVTSCMLISILGISNIKDYARISLGFLPILFVTAAFILTVVLTIGFKYVKGSLGKVFPDFGIRENITILGLYTVTFFLFSTGVYLASSSILGLRPDLFLTLVGFFTFAFLAGYVTPITPGGIGLREAIITLGLSATFSAPLAGLIAIFSRIILVITELLYLGFVFAWKKMK